MYIHIFVYIYIQDIQISSLDCLPLFSSSPKISGSLGFSIQLLALLLGLLHVISLGILMLRQQLVHLQRAPQVLFFDVLGAPHNG